MYKNARALRYALLLALASSPLLLPVPAAQSAESASASFRNTRSDVNAGGRRKTSTNFREDASAGSLALTTATSSGYRGRGGLAAAYHYPARVTDLWGSSTAVTTEAYLQWTTPGNDGFELSTPGAYVVRYSSVAADSPAISDAKFDAAQVVTPSPPAAQAKGSRVTMTVTGLQGGVTYYFAVKTAERDGTRSALCAGATVQTLAPYGCAVVRYVHKTNGPYTDIQSAVDALPKTLPGHACVIINDAATYPEQVTVRNFVNYGSSISIFTDPAVGAYATVSPLAASTAAFSLHNDSVNVMGLRIVVDQAVPYGILASSGYVSVSSVSISTSGSLGVYAAGVRLSSWSAVSYSTITVWNAHGIMLTGPAGGNAVFYSTANVKHGNFYALYLVDSDSNVVAGSYLSNAGNIGGVAAWVANGAEHNEFTQSVFVASATVGAALYLFNADSNSVTSSFIRNDLGYALRVTGGADYNAVTGSTVTASATGGYAAFFDASDGGRLQSSYFENRLGYGVYLDNGSDYAQISQSSMVSRGAGGTRAALYMGNADSNTVTQSYIRNDLGYALYLAAGADDNDVVLSTMISASAAGAAISLNSADRNTVMGTYIQNQSGPGVILSVGADFNTISQSTITSDAAGYPALSIQNSSAAAVLGGLVMGSTAVYVSASTGTVIRGAVLIATNTAGSALALDGGSRHLTVATVTLQAPSLGRGLSLTEGGGGQVSLASVTVTGAACGLLVSTQAAGFSLVVDSITFHSLVAGATAVHFLGGTFVSTITAAQFADSSVGANVSGLALDLASRVTMRGFYGSRAGPNFENDPNSLVDWAGWGPPTNVQLWFVGMSSAGLTYDTVGATGYTVQASTNPDFSGGVSVSSTVFGDQDRLTTLPLMPNTTYYLRAGALYGATTIYAEAVIATATLSQLVTGTTVYQIDVTSMVINWHRLALAPPDASSMSASGYILEASSMSTFAPLWATSATPNVALSTLTIPGLRGGVTYYFRVGSLNHNGVPHFAGAVSTLMPVQLGVELSTHVISVPGLVSMNTSVLITTSVIVTNTGNVKETYWVRATTMTVGSPWSIGAAQGTDRYVMSMLINPTAPLAGDFGAEDRLDDPEQACTAAVFAFGGNCVQVPVGESRLLWFKLDTPLVTSTIAPQDIRIFARAVRDPDPDPNP